MYFRYSCCPLSPHTVYVGDYVTLWCLAMGQSLPTVQWYQNDKPVERHPEPSVQIFVAPTKYSHNTKYSCVGRNLTESMVFPNTVTANVTVIVQGIKLCFVVCYYMLQLFICNRKV